MKKSFIVGVFCTFIGVLTGFFLKDWTVTAKICGYGGFAALIIAGIFEGSYVSGDRLRANYATETREDRNQRENFASYLLGFSIPNILTAIFLYLRVIN